MGGVVAHEGDAVDEVLLPFLHADGHVDDRVAVDAGRRPVVLEARDEVGEHRHLVVADGPVGLAGHVERVADHLLRVVVPRLQPREDPAQRLGPQHVVPVVVQGPDAVPLSLAHRNPQPHRPALAGLGHVEVFELGLADLRLDVAVVPVVRHQQVGVLLEPEGPVRPPAADEREQPALLREPHLALERPLADVVVADEGDVRHLNLGPRVDVEGELHDPGSAGQGGDLVGHLGELEPLLRPHLPQQPLGAPDHAGPDAAVEAQLDADRLHRLVDLGPVVLLGALEVDDADPLALLHHEDRAAALDPVGIGVVDDLDREIGQEAGVPQPLEVAEQHLLDRLVVGGPPSLGRQADVVVDLHVVDVRLALHAEDVALGGGRQLDRCEKRRRVGRGQGRRLELPGLRTRFAGRARLARRHGCADRIQPDRRDGDRNRRKW